MVAFFVFLFCLFATYATYLFTTRKTTARRAQVARRLAEALDHSPQMAAPVRLARPEVLSEIAWLERWLKRMEWAVELKQLIEQADLRLTVSRFILFSVVACFLGMMIASIFVNVNALITIAGLLAAAVPYLHIRWKRRQRLDKFLADLPDALDMISRAIAAGHGLQAALYLISTEMPDPIATEFGRVYEEQGVGLPIRTSLENLQRRVPLLDLKLSVIALLVQRETGGNLSEILDRAAQTIRERFRIAEDLKTVTTSSQLSAWLLCALPVMVIFLVTWINPEYMDPMWHDPRGQRLLVLAVSMQLAGLVLVRKILRIQV